MRSILPPLALAGALAFASPALAQEPGGQVDAQREPQAAPRLIVALSVDQFSSDLFDQYRAHFSKGLARLQTGVVFPQGYQSHAATETCPGHSTLLTGVHPARTGIPANSWYEPGIARADKEVYCVEDESDPKSTSDKPVVSPKHLLAPTLGDLLKRRDPRTINAAVSVKDRAAVMMSGHDTDAVYWFGEGTGGYTTFAGRKLGKAARETNLEVARQIAAGAGDMAVPGWCAPFDRATRIKDFTIGTYRFAMDKGDEEGVSETPRGDLASTALAIRLVDELGMGRDDVPDVLSVSYSATDKVGHDYGTAGVEMCITMNTLDVAIGQLFDALDARGIDYEVVLSADHGGFDAPERQQQRGNPEAGRIDPALEGDALAEAVTARTGIRVSKGKLLYGGGESGSVWFSAELDAAQKAKVSEALIALLKANPQVVDAFSEAEVMAHPMPKGHPQDWSMLDKVRASFVPGRSGEVQMLTRRGIVPGTAKPKKVASHGSPWDYDRRVPMLFWRAGMDGFEQPNPVETVDIAPTLAATVDLTVPEGTWDGTCLDIDGSERNSCS